MSEPESSAQDTPIEQAFYIISIVGFLLTVLYILAVETGGPMTMTKWSNGMEYDCVTTFHLLALLSKVWVGTACLATALVIYDRSRPHPLSTTLRTLGVAALLVAMTCSATAYYAATVDRGEWRLFDTQVCEDSTRVVIRSCHGGLEY